eukprot:COSAG04_NODE_438_length_14426_cov_10.589795_1_plen_224_part_00
MPMRQLAPLLLAAVALAGPARAGDTERRLQAGAPAAEPALCAQLAELGRLRQGSGVCASDPDLCPEACAVAAAGAPPPPSVCDQLAGRGQCGGLADLCPDECSASGSSGGEAPDFRWSCPVLLRLEAGCAHDLSLDDPSIAPNTKVSGICPAECAGRGGCAPTALDASFLGVTDDGSGNGHELSLAGDAGSRSLRGPTHPSTPTRRTPSSSRRCSHSTTARSS